MIYLHTKYITKLTVDHIERMLVSVSHPHVRTSKTVRSSNKPAGGWESRA